MECWACGKGLAEGGACYRIEDEQARYPLCAGCFETCDLLLLAMEREGQLSIDMIAEMEITL